MFWADQVPVVTPSPGVSVTLVAGSLQGILPPPPPPHSYAAKAESDVAIWTIALAPRASWTLPAAAPGSSRFLYAFAAQGLVVAGRALPGPSLLAIDPGSAVSLECGETPVELLLLQGRPIAEPVAQYGPFVMNTRAQLQQAFADYERTQFGGWRWDSPDPVHGREGRFARRPDGVVERPGNIG